MNINQLYNEETNRLQLKILFPITYLLIFLSIFISTIYDYKNLRGKKDSNLPDLQYFIVIFIILILINLVVYLILGAIFLALFRGIRECTSSISLRIFLLIFFGINLIIISFSWWFFGNIWWKDLVLQYHAQLRQMDRLVSYDRVIYRTNAAANILGIIGFIFQICIVLTASKQ